VRTEMGYNNSLATNPNSPYLSFFFKATCILFD